MKIILTHIIRNIKEKKGRSFLIILSLMIASVVFILLSKGKSPGILPGCRSMVPYCFADIASVYHFIEYTDSFRIDTASAFPI